MPDSSDKLTPPKKENTTDPGAHELESSESDDHFSDAQSAQSESHRASPVPRLRVEKISDEPSYGEVPGTEAYRLREGDAEPDEIAIIPEAGSERDSSPRSPTPGGQPIPKTVVEESPDSEGSETHPEKKHKGDPPPDLVLKPGGRTAEGGQGPSDTDTPISPALKTPSSARLRRKASSNFAVEGAPASAGFGDEADDDFGDDLDDFEEGGDNDDAEFGDFDEGFEAPSASQAPAPAVAPPPTHSFSFPIPDFEGLDPDEIISATEPYLNALYQQDDDLPSLPPLSRDNPVFLSQRSASLWAQLVAPPPLQPPDWIRSRIRRLFLVSLGVPVDLDEILPASKQKKLILPSLSAQHRDSPRTSTDSRAAPNNLARLKQPEANGSSTSVDSQGRPKDPSSKRRRGATPVPPLDLVASRQLCATTDEALGGMTDGELREHVKRLQALEGAAKEVLEYWTKKTDEQISNREAFEGVIENLVKHARKVRK